MKPMFRGLIVLAILAMAACSTTHAPPPPIETAPAAEARTEASSPSQGAPAPAPPEPAARSADELKRLQVQQKRDTDEEAQRLAPYQKNLFQVFRLSETLAGFKAKPNAVGVYELAATRVGKLRLALAQLPNSPARLSTGNYVLTLDLEIIYTEKQECLSGPCSGTTQQFERNAVKSVQLTLNPKNNFSATTTMPLVEARLPAAGPRYRSSYSNLVLTVRRMSATPAKD